MPQNTPTKPTRRDNEVASRIAIIALLSVTLIGAMKWALNITQANAKQISGNAVRWQDQIDARIREKRTP